MRLTKQTTVNLKGLLAVAIVFCHLTPVIASEDSTVRSILLSFGYLSVSMFFFLSGFGLYEQYQKLGDSYIRRFPKSRIFPFYAICITAILLYVFRDLLLYGKLDTIVLLKSFFFGETVVDKGWYLQTQLLFYLCFWFSFRFLKTKKLVALTGSILVYIVLCRVLQLPSYLYESAICFPVGCFASRFRDHIQKPLQSKTACILLAAGALLLFGVTFLLGNVVLLPPDGKLLAKCLSALFFDFFVVLCLTFVRIECALLWFLGQISLEIYLIHGLFIKLFKDHLVVSNRLLYGVLVLGLSIAVAWLMHPIFEKIKSVTKNIV